MKIPVDEKSYTNNGKISMDFSRAWTQTLPSKYFRNELQVTSKETKFSKRESKIQDVFSTTK